MGIATEGATLVLDVARLYKEPLVLNSCRPNAGTAVRFWQNVSAVLLFGSIALSVAWHWWAFIVGFVAGAIVQTNNKQTAIKFAMQGLAAGQGTPTLCDAGIVYAVPNECVVNLMAKR